MSLIVLFTAIKQQGHLHVEGFDYRLFTAPYRTPAINETGKLIRTVCPEATRVQQDRYMREVSVWFAFPGTLHTAQVASICKRLQPQLLSLWEAHEADAIKSQKELNARLPRQRRSA